MQLSKTAPTVLPVSYEQFLEQQKSRKTGSDSLTQQDFLNLLVTQLKNQDPLNPMDNAEFTSQTTAFSQLEQMIAMNTSLTTMVEAQAGDAKVDQSLMYSASFIGRTIEYSTNTLNVKENDVSGISFYSSDAAVNGTIRIYNSEGNMVAMIESGQIVQGQNGITWDGTDAGGTKLVDGMYTFEVEALNAAGEAIEFGTYGESMVTGIKVNGGELYFQVSNGLVPAENVYAVKQ